MKFHKQEHLVTPGKTTRGSCHPTVIACLLDKELHEVPYFHLFYYTEEERNNFTKVFLERYCNGNLETAEQYQKDNFNRNLSLALNHWYNTMDFWLAGQGYEETYISKEKFPDWIESHPNTPYMVSGLSSRKVRHVVIFMDGKLLHDPHPSDEGLLPDGEGDYEWQYKYLKKIVNS